MKKEVLERGDQIVFTYSHGAKQWGFVTSKNSKHVFCRFWSDLNLGSLRTLSCSEGCEPSMVEKTGENVPQPIIEAWLELIEKGT